MLNLRVPHFLSDDANERANRGRRELLQRKERKGLHRDIFLPLDIGALSRRAGASPYLRRGILRRPARYLNAYGVNPGLCFLATSGHGVETPKLLRAV